MERATWGTDSRDGRKWTTSATDVSTGQRPALGIRKYPNGGQRKKNQFVIGLLLKPDSFSFKFRVFDA